MNGTTWLSFPFIAPPSSLENGVSGLESSQFACQQRPILLSVALPEQRVVKMELYSYWRSSAAYRVRIALHWKGLSYETVPVNLLENRQRSDEYRALNPQGLVPCLVDGDACLTQSLAIIEYLDETYPNPPLLPGTPLERARIRAVAEAIACDIHPINNLRVLKYLKDPLGHDASVTETWYRHWIAEGFAALEQMASDGPYFMGETVTLADVCLVPQMANARRYKMSLDAYPKLAAIDAACRKLEPFAAAEPAVQPDAVAS